MVDENLYLFTGTAEIFIQNRISRIISSYDKQQISIIKYDMEQTPFSRVLEDESLEKVFIVELTSVNDGANYEITKWEFVR